MKQYRNLRISEVLEIFGTLSLEGWNNKDIAKYVKFITWIAKKINRSVMFVFDTQRKYATAQVNDLIKGFTI